MITILGTVAEMERENIITQTMLGREEKSRQGGWCGGFAPFGVEFCAGRYIWIYLHSSTCRHPVRPAPFVEDVFFFFPLYGFGFFIRLNIFCFFLPSLWVWDSNSHSCYADLCLQHYYFSLLFLLNFISIVSYKASDLPIILKHKLLNSSIFFSLILSSL